MTHPGDEFVEKVSQEQLLKTNGFVDELMCKICLVNVVGCAPKMTKCSHLFCGDCLESWFAQHPSNQTWAQRAKAGGAVPCPVCKMELKKDCDVHAVEKHGKGDSALLWRMISALQVRCQSSCEGSRSCQWTGNYGAYWDHVHGGTCGLVSELDVENTTALEPVAVDPSDACAAVVDAYDSDDPEEEACTSPARDPYPSDDSSLICPTLPQQISSAEETQAQHRNQVDEAESMPGMRDLCAMVKSLVELKEKEHASSKSPTVVLDEEVVAVGSDTIGSDSCASPAPSPLSLADCIRPEDSNVEEVSLPSPAFERTSRTQRISDLPDDVEPDVAQTGNAPGSAAAALAAHVKHQNALATHAASYQAAARLQALQWQHATQMAQWQQQASMAYAGHMAQYQMAAAYQAQAQQTLQYQKAAHLRSSHKA